MADQGNDNDYEFEPNAYLSGYGGLMGGLDSLDPKAQEMIRNNLLISAGARLLGGSAAGEKFGTSVAGAAMTGLDTVDSLLTQGLKTQMSNRTYNLQKERNKLLTDAYDRNKSAAESYSKSIGKKPDQMTTKELSIYQGFMNGDPMASSYLRSGFGAFGEGGYGLDATEVPDPAAPGSGGEPTSWYDSIGNILSGVNNWLPYEGRPTTAMSEISESVKGAASQPPSPNEPLYIRNLKAARRGEGSAQPTAPMATVSMPEFGVVPTDLPQRRQRDIYDMLGAVTNERQKKAIIDGLEGDEKQYAIDILTWNQSLGD